MLIQESTHPSPLGEIKLVKITNAHGASVTLSSLGAGITDLSVPDANGNLRNVALAYQNPADYLADGPCMGKTPGRYANRIAAGHLEINGKTHHLPINNGPNHLHGGPDGFQNKLWNTELLPNGVRFSLFSPDGDQNYPANLNAAVEYRWNDFDELSIDLYAEADAPTVVNLTNHTYWNLDGADNGSILDHTLRIAATHWLPTDDTLIPTGEFQPVDGTPMDFHSPKPLGADIHADFPALRFGKGYDNCWLLIPDSNHSNPSHPDTPRFNPSQPDNTRFNPSHPDTLTDAVLLHSPHSGITLHVDTDQPGVQVYTGNWLDGSPLNRSGRHYRDYEGVAIEAQGLPDAPNKPSFPSQAVDPSHPYHRTIRYRFTH